MSLTKPSDYKGSVKIAQNDFDTDFLQDYLDEKEPDYLRDLLGCELYDLFVADLINGIPQTQRFIDIYNAFCNDIDSICFIDPIWNAWFIESFCFNEQNRSRGVMEMLKGFMYFEYVRDQPIANSSVGPNVSVGIASDLVPLNSTAIKKAYNKSIKDYWNIQFFIQDNETDYPEFNGVIKRSISIL